MPLDLSKKRLSKLFYTIFVYLYTAGIHIAALFNAKARQWVKGRREPLLFDSIGNRPPATNCVWMHCASLGEFEQGRPLLESVRSQYPDVKIALSFFSPSGYEVMKNYALADMVFYLPIDSAVNASMVIAGLKPNLVLWVKYEFWFHYLSTLRQKNIPVILVSGIFRSSQPFFKWYGALWKTMLACFTKIFVQTTLSENLLSDNNLATAVEIGGDTRFDRVICIAENFKPVPFIDAFCGDKKVIVAGSTWEDDEEELTHYCKANPQIKFIIAPHEIDAGNLKDVKAEFSNAVFYSDWMKDQSDHSANVLIIDNVGMLSRLYHYADITYVGGGFGSDGVHNVLEAAVYGKPVIYGPEFEKFAEAVDLVDCGGALVINNALELEKILTELWSDNDLLKSKGDVAKNYVYTHGGATKKIMDYIQENRLLTS